MPALKAAYLIHGDDHGRIGERRARLRALAESESGVSGLELFEAERSTPAVVGRALAAMTFALGRRFLIADGVERWRDADVESELAGVLRDPPPDTTVAFFAREEGRHKAPAALHRLVAAAGGEIAKEATPPPWELPRWARAQAARLGLRLDAAAAAALVAQVGERPQRLVRELERLALELPPADGRGLTITAEDIEAGAARSSESRVFAFADALLAGDGPAATRLYLRLRAQGERLGGLLYWMTQRIRQAQDVAERLAAGEPEAAVRKGLKMPPKAADRLLAEARRADPERLRRGVELIAGLERDTRGGVSLSTETTTHPESPRRWPLSEDTQAILAIAALTGYAP